jgi:hypothetical protein
VAARLFERGLCLPSGSGMSPSQQALVVGAIAEVTRTAACEYVAERVAHA